MEEVAKDWLEQPIGGARVQRCNVLNRYGSPSLHISHPCDAYEFFEVSGDELGAVIRCFRVFCVFSGSSIPRLSL
jgi:hypothetical protein